MIPRATRIAATVSAASIGGDGCNLSQNGVGGSSTDPLFTTDWRGDFHLSPGSPAIDACGGSGDNDLDNNPRPIGAGHDMGAFEFFIDGIFGDRFEQP